MRVTRARAQQNQNSRPTTPDNDTMESSVDQENVEISKDSIIPTNEQLVEHEPPAKKKKGKKKSKKGKKDKADVKADGVDSEKQAVDDNQMGDEKPEEVEEPVVEKDAESKKTEPESIEMSPPDVEQAIESRKDDTKAEIEETESVEIESKNNDVSANAEATVTTPTEPTEKTILAQPDTQNETDFKSLEVDTTATVVDTKSLISPNENLLSSKGTSLLTSPTIVSPRSEDPIEAMDALEDAIEEMGKILPKVPLSPEKPRKKAPTKTLTTTAAKSASLLLASKIQRAPAKAPVVKSTLSSRSAATKPVATGSLLKTTQPSAISRTTSLRTTRPTKVAPSTTLASKRQSMLQPKRSDDTKTANKSSDSLITKRRPISMQYPPPPQPIKSTKLVTKASFTLPGDAISARRKAEADEKRKKEEEEAAKKREFKARPAPTSNKSRPASMLIKQTASSRARLSVVDGVDANAIGRKENVSPANTGLKRSNTVTAASQSGPTRVASTVSKRMTLTESASKSSANTAVKRGSIYGKPTDATTTASKRASMVVPRQPMSASAVAARKSLALRPKSMMVNTAQAPPTGAKPSVEESLALRQKAKGVYNRARDEKDALEREKREKEEASKRARSVAAEKGRQASREWAEKQKKKSAEHKAANQPAEPAITVV